MDLKAKLRDIIYSIVKVNCDNNEKAHIKKIIYDQDNFDFFEDIGMDSIDIMSLIMDVEEKFNICISDDVELIDSLTDFNRFYVFLLNKRNQYNGKK